MSTSYGQCCFFYHTRVDTRVVVLTFEPVDKILKCSHSMKATQQYFPVVLFNVLCKVVLTFESVDKCEHSTERYDTFLLY